MFARGFAPTSTVAVLFSALLVSGCGSTATTATSPSNLTRCSVTVNGTATVPAQGGSGTVTVSAARECSWVASIEGQWLSIKNGATGQGDGAVEFAAVANPAPAIRKGALVVNDQRFEVAQGAGECTVTLAESAATFAQAGGSGRIDVRASNAQCPWTAEPEAAWIVIRGETSGQGNAQVPFDVMPMNGPPRTASIKIAGQRFTVTQAEGCAYAINPVGATATAAGSSGAVTVTTAAGCPWSAVSNVAWLSLSPNAGSGPGEVKFTIAPADSSRNGTATIAGQTFTVAQSQGCSFVVSPLTHTVGAAGGSISVAVTTAADCTWNANSNDSWIVRTSPGTVSGSGTAVFAVSPSSDARSGSVNVAGQDVQISQSQACSYAISPDNTTVPAAGGAGKVSVTAGSGCPWNATSNAPWIQIVGSAIGSGNGEVAFQVTATTATGRTGTLTVAGRTFTVVQGAACSYALSATTQAMPVEGGNGTVGVTAGTNCAWSATSNAEWLTITSGASGTSNGAVAFSVPALSGPGRTGTLTIAGLTFTVTQASACTFAITPETQTVGAAGTTSTVSVISPAGCPWTVASNVPWMTVRSLGPESGNGNVQVIVAANTGAARTGTATIAGRTFTVTQGAGVVCTYSVDPLTINLSSSSRLRNFDVTTTSSCSWTATSNVPWIQPTSTGTRTGSGEASFFISENTGADRTGTLTIAGQTVTVTQRGH